MSWVTPGEELERADTNDAVELGERIWWVGHHLEGDPFQCHAYLIEHGTQSVLIDPGSRLTFPETLRKIEQIIPFDHVRWLVCQHQDPDITAALTTIDRVLVREDAAIVTHWRARALLKHYGLRLPFWLVDEHSWQLDLGGRMLRFVFTPYLHFPGAFVTFDERTGILFSSDLFGGFTDDWSLVARDESYFEAMRPFHEHYMPSREILALGLSRLDPLPIQMIAPQHGSVIPERLVATMIQQLKGLECGLYLMVDEDTDIQRLFQMNEMLRKVLQQLTIAVDFGEIARGLLDVINQVLPADSLEFYARAGDGCAVHFEPTTHYRGVHGDPRESWAVLCGLRRPDETETFPVVCTPPGLGATGGGELVIPLFSPSTDMAEGLAVIRLREPVTVAETMLVALAQMSGPMQVALEREQLLRSLEMRRQELYTLATHDSLTGLYNRVYLRDATERLFALDDRAPGEHLAVAVLDLDRFKRINDTYGHAAGDAVLQRAAAVLQDSTRGADLAVRFGGEEFLLLQVTSSVEEAREAVERIRCGIGELDFGDDLAGERVTASAGVALREAGEDFDHLLARADRALYRAKDEGRDGLVVA